MRKTGDGGCGGAVCGVGVLSRYLFHTTPWKVVTGLQGLGGGVTEARLALGPYIDHRNKVHNRKQTKIYG